MWTPSSRMFVFLFVSVSDNATSNHIFFFLTTRTNFYSQNSTVLCSIEMEIKICFVYQRNSRKELAVIWIQDIQAVCRCTYCIWTLHYLKMTAKLACQQSYIHLSNFTCALVLLPNIDQEYGASLPFWRPQGNIREFLSALLEDSIQTCKVD